MILLEILERNIPSAREATSIEDLLGKFHDNPEFGGLKSSIDNGGDNGGDDGGDDGGNDGWEGNKNEGRDSWKKLIVYSLLLIALLYGISKKTRSKNTSQDYGVKKTKNYIIGVLKEDKWDEYEYKK